MGMSSSGFSAAIDREYSGRKRRKIKRRLHYHVRWWDQDQGELKAKHFNSARKFKKFSLYLINKGGYLGSIEMERVWCYRNYTPKKKWWFKVSGKGNLYIIEVW